MIKQSFSQSTSNIMARLTIKIQLNNDHDIEYLSFVSEKVLKSFQHDQEAFPNRMKKMFCRIGQILGSGSD